MRVKLWRSCCLPIGLAALLACLLFVGLGPVTAQDSNQQEGDQPIGRLVISSADASSAPTIVLRAYAVDDQGVPINLTAQNVIVTHDGQPAADVETVADYLAGAFTIFVVDIPPGVGSQLETLQQAVEHFASPPELQEPADYIAIYQVGEDQATQLLAPVNFYNSIRNFFSQPLTSQSGPTALLDSLGSLLEDVESLKPKPDMATSVVLITDGTDAISERFQPNDIALRAAALGVPIHTIWVENENLQPFSHQAGQDYLGQLAAATGGLYSQLDQAEGLQAIWDRIGQLRTHSTIQYRPENLAGGTANVSLSLRDNPAVSDSATVTIPASAPSVVINLPAESRQLSLEDLEDPVALTFSTTVSWLDGVDRKLTAAQLLVNGTMTQEINVRDLDQFRAEISNFSFGPNTVQIAIEDETGQKATSPAVVLNITEGEQQLPAELESQSAFGNVLSTLALGCFVLLLLLAAIGLVVLIVRRQRSAPRPRREYRSSDPAKSSFPEDELAPPGQARRGRPYLEILESVTRMPSAIELAAPEHRLGRNPTQADIAFENDITVSRLHASLMLEGNDYRLYDEASSSGTFVNDQTVPEYGYQLVDGDEIRLGAVTLRYRSG